MERALVETIAHEVGHIGKSRTQEQILQGPFHGEGEAESFQKQIMQRVPKADDFPLSKREQEAMDAITPTPSDKPFGSLIPGYENWHSEIGNNPYGIMTIPLGVGGGGR